MPNKDPKERQVGSQQRQVASFLVSIMFLPFSVMGNVASALNCLNWLTMRTIQCLIGVLLTVTRPTLFSVWIITKSDICRIIMLVIFYISFERFRAAEPVRCLILFIVCFCIYLDYSLGYWEVFSACELFRAKPFGACHKATMWVFEPICAHAQCALIHRLK